MGISSLLSTLKCVTFRLRDALFFLIDDRWDEYHGVWACCKFVGVRPERGMMDRGTGM